MAFRDWNGDGKKDMADDFIEYQIYKDVTKDSNDSSGSSNSNYSRNSSDNSGCYMSFCIVVFLFIFSLISKCS